jgi:hypothetical protein
MAGRQKELLEQQLIVVPMSEEAIHREQPLLSESALYSQALRSS